ncbi:type II secretion system F family protein [Candidatus Margulisiibacteriota bacterium]
MTRFKYKAIDENGKIVQEEIEAASPEDVANDLNAKGFTPVSISEKSALADLTKIFNPAEFQFRKPRVKRKDLMMFFRQMAALFAAGVPLFESLIALEEQFTKEKIKAIIIKLKEDVSAGNSFSNALSKHPAVFTELMVSMVEAGERAGVMEDVLKKIADFMEKDYRLRQNIQAALRYPMIVVVFLAIAFVCAILVIIPKFMPIFKAFKTGLPLPTRLLLGINHILVHYWLLVLIVLVVGSALLKLYRASAKGRLQWDQFLLRLPVFGMLIRKISLARFFTMLAAMIASGISVVQALEITANTADNAVISQAVLKIREKVTAGVSLSESMKEFSLFPPAAVHMVAVGEKSGSLGEMLMKSADYFNEETDYAVANLMSLLEPMIIMVLAFFVLILVLGIFLPMMNIMKLYTQ